MPVIYKRSITVKDLNDNPDTLFLFCENAEYSGDDEGLAKFRGEENAVGIRLKYRSGNKRSAHISCESSFEGFAFLDEDLEPVLEHAKAGGTVVIPSHGFVPSRLCEDVKAYLLEKLEEMEDDGDE
jgi:hypothetical protein